MVISPARRVAFDVLERVEGGAWASDLLVAMSEQLASCDAGLAREITFGCLRRQAQLDFLIRFYSGRDPASLDAPVRTALRMGIYQRRYMDRIPAHAAVGESVELVKAAKKRSAAGLANAVLRKVTREEIAWPDRPTALSMPRWILERWDEQFGPEISARIAEAFLSPPETWLRNPPLEAGLTIEQGDVPGAYRLVSGEARGLRVQDIGSQAVVPLLGLRPGHTFLDLCAAPGNKTAQALETGIQAVACDLHLHRLRHVAGCDRVLLDATQPLPFARRFDRILVDAPCSGTGTLGRNPEIRWRLRLADLTDLHVRQVAMLMHALPLLAPDGRLVYSTCSLQREENEEVVAEVIGNAGGFVLSGTYRRTPALHAGDGFFAAVLTSE
ncbi:MAG: hypothetical protein HYS04_05835 [Acidobacteria bacterium]|nr:hypothetical protein [Acidobacteriota bacterium]